MPTLLPRSFRSRVIALVVLGVALRVGFLFAAGDLDPFRDESSYIYVAACWIRYGFYPDRVDFLWPPGYPAYLACFLRLFGVSGLFLAKLGQCLLAGVVGASVALLARRLFNRRAALIAAALWAVHLPFVGFTHYLWPETIFLALFLPALFLLLRWVEEPTRSATRTTLPAGLLFGLAALVKESALPVIALSCVAILWHGRSKLAQTLPVVTGLALSVLVVILPWGLRNQAVYGHFSLLGATTGQNVYIGVNGRYRNFDVLARRVYTGDELVWRLFIEPPPESAWERADAGNVFDRSAENLSRGLAFARAQPGYVARSRVKRVADWLTPLSFTTRHVQNGLYQGWLARPLARAALTLGAIATTLLVLAGSLPGFFLGVRASERPFLLAAILGVAGGTALVGISRYRMPIEPLLLVLTAGALAGCGRPWRLASRNGVALAAACIVLASLWMIEAREVLWVFGEVLP